MSWFRDKTLSGKNLCSAPKYKSFPWVFVICFSHQRTCGTNLVGIVQVLVYRVGSYRYRDPENAFIISYNPPGRPQ